MYKDSTVGVVVPAYNEAGFVGSVLRDIPDFADRIYAIDDASTDETWREIVETADTTGKSTQGTDTPLDVCTFANGERTQAPAHADTSSRRLFERRVGDCRCTGDVVAIQHAENFGAGGAIKTGYLAALIDGVDIVVTIDADGQMDPTIMERFLVPIVEGTAEYTKGTRFADSEYRDEMPLIRTVGNLALTYMTKVASGYWGVTDSQNGYTAITRSALRRIDVEDLFEYYAYCNAVLVRLNVHDVPVADIEVPTQYGEENSDIEYVEFIAKVTPMLSRKFLWRLWRKYLVRRTPSVSGTTFLTVSLLVAVVVALSIRVSRLTGRGRAHSPEQSSNEREEERDTV